VSTRAPLIAFAVGLSTLAACEAKVDYHTVQFPGFTLSVPTTTTYTRASTMEYRAGQSASSGLLRIVQVTWQIGEISTKDEMPAMVDAMEALLPEASSKKFEPAYTATVNGHESVQIDGTISVDGTKLGLSIVDIACGKRSVTLTIVAAHKMAALKKHVVDSFECKPDPAEEETIGTSAVPFGVDDPKVLDGWKRMADESTFMLEKDGTVLVVTQTPQYDADDKKAFERMMPDMFRAYGIEWATTGQETRPSVTGMRTLYLGTVTSSGVPLPSAMTLFPCHERADGVMAIAMAGDGGLEQGIALVLAMRCAQPKDAPLDLPASTVDTEE
jgi:hypothetical protein